jgi:hypothetical protein
VAKLKDEGELKSGKSDATERDALSAWRAASDGDGGAAAERCDKSERCMSAAASNCDSCKRIFGVLCVRGHAQVATSEQELWTGTFSTTMTA